MMLHHGTKSISVLQMQTTRSQACFLYGLDPLPTRLGLEYFPKDHSICANALLSLLHVGPGLDFGYGAISQIPHVA